MTHADTPHMTLARTLRSELQRLARSPLLIAHIACGVAGGVACGAYFAVSRWDPTMGADAFAQFLGALMPLMSGIACGLALDEEQAAGRLANLTALPSRSLAILAKLATLLLMAALALCLAFSLFAAINRRRGAPHVGAGADDPRMRGRACGQHTALRARPRALAALRPQRRHRCRRRGHARRVLQRGRPGPRPHDRRAHRRHAEYPRLRPLVLGCTAGLARYRRVHRGRQRSRPGGRRRLRRPGYRNHMRRLFNGRGRYPRRLVLPASKTGTPMARLSGSAHVSRKHTANARHTRYLLENIDKLVTLEEVAAST